MTGTVTGEVIAWERRMREAEGTVRAAIRRRFAAHLL